jgi:16S rRNA (adenine1518-N6/adenine1519-N6)-dimethyltransferase
VSQRRQASAARKPKLGQNFLSDIGTARKIVQALGDVSGAVVVEIGPGRGALTRALVERARRLIAIELDRVLAAQLRMQYARCPNLEVIEGDVLAIDFSRLTAPGPGALSGFNHEQEKVKVVGNLPYYITSEILLRLFHYHEYLSEIVIMVQREVADRITAKPGAEYGLLSVTAQLYGRVEKLFSVPPGAFTPPPKVHSAVLRMRLEPQFGALRVPEREFLDFLKQAFAQKRKTLINNLKSRYDSGGLRAALKAAGLRADVRAEALSPAKLAALYRQLHA